MANYIGASPFDPAQNFSLSSQDPKNLFDCAERCQDLKKRVSLLYLSANLGHAPARYELSLCYKEGIGVEKDSDQFLFHLQKAAEGKYVVAQQVYANVILQEHQKKEPKEIVQAICYLKVAAKQRHPQALLDLSACYFQGIGVPQNENEGLKYLLEAAKLDHADAKKRLEAFRQQEGMDLKKRISLLEWLASQEYAPALLDLSDCYFQGIGVSKNENIGLQHLMHANRLRDDEARKRLLERNQVFMQVISDNIDELFSVGKDHITGGGHTFKKNVELGWHLIRRAEEKGSKQAREFIEAANSRFQQLQMGEKTNNTLILQDLSDHYRYGIGRVPKDLKKSLEYLSRAAELGDLQAQIRAGTSYMEGKDGEKDLAKAYRFLKMAANQGHVQAKEICQRIEMATFFQKLKKAADEGDAESQWQVAGAYFNGRGCKKSSANGALYVKMAADQGHSHALLYLGGISAENALKSYDFSETLDSLEKIKHHANAYKVFSAVKQIWRKAFDKLWQLAVIQNDAETNAKRKKLENALQKLDSLSKLT